VTGGQVLQIKDMMHKGAEYVAPNAKHGHAQAWGSLHRLRHLVAWWLAWAAWLEAKSDAELVAPLGIGAPSRGLIPLVPHPGSLFMSAA
jgi:poly(3-hydroxyalkanoate) synthetase